MLHRVSLDHTSGVIKAIEEDGGVILAGFAPSSQVDQVNQDIQKVLESRVNDEVLLSSPFAHIKCHFYYY
jgi:hypothetical protein